jgi:hypothetical protein
MISGVWLVWVWLSAGLIGLATGVRSMSSVWFGYRGETCKLYLVLTTGVRPVSCWPWVTVR